MSELCSKGCGFYANQGGMGMCSKCYRENRKEVEEQKNLMEKKRAEELDANKEKEERNKNCTRCFCCKKKLGLVNFNCKCDKTFCGIHRYAEKHECTFDFRKQGYDAIAKANPKVVASKVDPI